MLSNFNKFYQFLGKLLLKFLKIVWISIDNLDEKYSKNNFEKLFETYFNKTILNWIETFMGVLELTSKLEKIKKYAKPYRKLRYKTIFCKLW